MHVHRNTEAHIFVFCGLKSLLIDFSFSDYENEQVLQLLSRYKYCFETHLEKMWTYSLSFAWMLLEIIRRWLKQRLPQKPTTHTSSVWNIWASTHICYANICPLEGDVTSLFTVTAHSCIWPAGVTKVFIFSQQVSESTYNTDSSCTLKFLFFFF